MADTSNGVNKQMFINQWLCSVGLKAETEGFIMVAQDQSFFIRWYKARIIKKGTDHYVAKCVTNKMRH